MKRDKQGRRILPNLNNLPVEPPILEEEEDPFTAEQHQAIDEYWGYVQKEEAELEAIKAGRPLGSVVHREPKSLRYSKVPDPVWTRKLRP